MLLEWLGGDVENECSQWSIQDFTRTDPGSLTTGVPASLTSATDFPRGDTPIQSATLLQERENGRDLTPFILLIQRLESVGHSDSILKADSTDKPIQHQPSRACIFRQYERHPLQNGERSL